MPSRNMDSAQLLFTVYHSLFTALEVELSFPRTSGILLHPTSLPGRFGVGDLGAQAYRFVDWLAAAGQHLWQVLPLGPTGYGDSPYQCFSAFAGNTLLVSPDLLVERGLLAPGDLKDAPPLSGERVDYGGARAFKDALLRRAFENFRAARASGAAAEFEEFKRDASAWLDDYALYRSLKLTVPARSAVVYKLSTQ